MEVEDGKNLPTLYLLRDQPERWWIKRLIFLLLFFFFTSCFGGSLGDPQMNMLPMVLLFSPKWKGFHSLPSLSEFNDPNIISIINIMMAIVTVDVITGIVIL